MTRTIVTIPSPTSGEEQLYKRYRARLPEFLERFPLEQGYRVTCEVTDLLFLRRGLLELLREAIRAGRSLSDIGLTEVEPDIDLLVCTARLIGPNDRELRSGSALGRLEQPKDYECLESAACNRLLGAVGLSGDIFDDEIPAANGSRITPLTGSGSPSAVESVRVDTSAKQAEPSGTWVPAPGQPVPESGTRGTDTDQPVGRALLKQIQGLARRLGEPIPTVKTVAEGLNELNRLGHLETERRQASTTVQ